MTGRDMTDEEVRAELERIDKEQETGFALVYKAACDFVNGIPLKGIDTPGDRLLVDALRLLAEKHKALGEIAESDTVDDCGSDCSGCREKVQIARKHWKGGK